MENNREKIIVKTSIIGILANIFLSIFKAIIGIISNSIAIVLDAVNNLSDAMSSVITIVGTKLAGKAPDKKHPYGYGRIEYLTAMIISGIVLYAGATSLIEAMKKIITPETPDYSIISIVIISVGVIVKIFLGLYVKNKGNQVNSEALVDSGKDALMDSIISGATLLSAIIYILFKLSLEAYLASIISLVIVKSGFDMLKNTISSILGERIESDIAVNIKKTVINYSENIKGAYDLILNNYGPDTYMGSIHIEIPDTMNATEIDKLTRDVTREVYKKYNVLLAAVGIYSLNTQDKETMDMKKTIDKIAYSYKSVLQGVFPIRTKLEILL